MSSFRDPAPASSSCFPPGVPLFEQQVLSAEEGTSHFLEIVNTTNALFESEAGSAMAAPVASFMPLLAKLLPSKG